MVTHSEIIDLFKPLIMPISEGIIICDSSGSVLTANLAVNDIFCLGSTNSKISLVNLNGFNLRNSLINAGLDQQNSEGMFCEIPVKYEQGLEINDEILWLTIESRLLDLPGGNDRLRMIILQDITAEKRLNAVIASKEDSCFITEDPDMLRLLERLDKVAMTDASVLFQGESGTGKTELARRLHKNSLRANKPFIEVNCAAIPESLIETELFGHVKGAFTGAIKDRVGRFKAAEGGTLFLDEISELPRELQSKLLRVLQDGQFEAVGSDETQQVDVRVITASNQDLVELVDKKSFRTDLYYRISVFPFLVPPLRDRPGDIPKLIDVLKQKLITRGYPDSIHFSNEAMRPIMNYPWPGNVRELANVVEHSIICAIDGVVVADSLPDSLNLYCQARQQNTLPDKIPEINELEQIQNALLQANGNRTLAAQLLKIDRSTLWRRMQRLNIE